ncbi:MAG: RnfABCDGE type electron transport complex subunit B [Clostridiales bacterium]|nr:RnfABCDGE type electron transport complex subunit B [Clostridiales bacterium]
MDIFNAVLLLSGLGLGLGLVLSIVDTVVSVPDDENKAKELEEALPGYNCGVCGYPGCQGYAAALAEGKTDNLHLCVPGKKATIEKLEEILNS